MGDASIMADTKRFVSTVQQRAAELKKAGKTIDETVADAAGRARASLTARRRGWPGPIRAAYAQAP